MEQRGANSTSKAIRNIFDEGHWASWKVTGVMVFGDEEEREVNARFSPHHPLQKSPLEREREGEREPERLCVCRQRGRGEGHEWGPAEKDSKRMLTSH